MNISTLVKEYVKLGYELSDAESKVCQDIILLKIGKSKFNHNITIKGGVVMHNISKNMRRATRDIDLDFIKYSLGDESIKKFIKELNSLSNDVTIYLDGDITKLKHKDYEGKRVHLILRDKFGSRLETKLDIGVHKYFDILQDEYFFDFNLLGDSVSLLINSSEQIIVEKLKSLLRFGIRTTRYKDVFDFYYLIDNKNIKIDKLTEYIDILIIQDSTIKQNSMSEINERLESILTDKNFMLKLDNARSNWLEIPVSKVISRVLNYFKSLEKVTI